MDDKPSTPRSASRDLLVGMSRDVGDMAGQLRVLLQDFAVLSTDVRGHIADEAGLVRKVDELAERSDARHRYIHERLDKMASDTAHRAGAKAALVTVGLGAASVSGWLVATAVQSRPIMDALRHAFGI